MIGSYCRLCPPTDAQGLQITYLSNLGRRSVGINTKDTQNVPLSHPPRHMALDPLGRSPGVCVLCRGQELIVHISMFPAPGRKAFPLARNPTHCLCCWRCVTQQRLVGSLYPSIQSASQCVGGGSGTAGNEPASDSCAANKGGRKYRVVKETLGNIYRCVNAKFPPTHPHLTHHPHTHWDTRTRRGEREPESLSAGSLPGDHETSTECPDTGTKRPPPNGAVGGSSSSDCCA